MPGVLGRLDLRYFEDLCCLKMINSVVKSHYFISNFIITFTFIISYFTHSIIHYHPNFDFINVILVVMDPFSQDPSGCSLFELLMQIHTYSL